MTKVICDFSVMTEDSFFVEFNRLASHIIMKFRAFHEAIFWVLALTLPFAARAQYLILGRYK
jgi:hypothetical protein